MQTDRGVARIRLRHDPRVRRILLILSVAMITAGCVVLADAALTLAWKEPVSAIYGSLRQDEARSQLDRLEEQFLSGLDDPGQGLGRIARKARPAAGRCLRPDSSRTARRSAGSTSQSAGIDYVVVQGTDTADLKKGPGHYPETALPGQGKTIGIAGHRTTYGHRSTTSTRSTWATRIMLEMPYGTFTYKVEKTKIVEPTDVQIVDDVDHERLVLTACHPLYSAAERYAVFGKLERISLFGGGEAPWKSP